MSALTPAFTVAATWLLGTPARLIGHLVAWRGDILRARGPAPPGAAARPGSHRNTPTRRHRYHTERRGATMTETTPLAAAVSGWGRYRKKPVVIEAWQLVGTNAETHAVYQWIEANTQGSFDPLSEEIPPSGVSIDPATGFFLIATLEGVMQAKYGDWIIRGVQGEFYPIKDSIFRETYEPAEGES